jgi:hypothetical protein
VLFRLAYLLMVRLFGWLALLTRRILAAAGLTPAPRRASPTAG